MCRPHFTSFLLWANLKTGESFKDKSTLRNYLFTSLPRSNFRIIVIYIRLTPLPVLIYIDIALFNN